MAKVKGAHHRGGYQRQAKRVTDWANTNPDTRCRRCGLTLAEHPPTKTGNPPKWSAGHVIDGQVGGALKPEVLGCNSSAGATMGNLKRLNPMSRAW